MRRDQRTENIDAYMADIKGYERIDVKEEARLADLIRNGSPEERKAARNRLICANLRLVVKIAHDFKNFELGFADLVAEGNLGLLTAADKFDPSKGAKFSCYAAWWIKQYMRKALAWDTRTIRIPGGSAQKLINIRKAAAAFRIENDREPTVEELAGLTGISAVTVANLGRVASETFSLYETVGGDSATTFDSLLADTVEDESETREARAEILSAAVERLSDEDRLIVSGTFGVGGPRLELKTLAQELGMHAKAVLQRLQEILDRLRDELGAALSLA